MAAASWCGWGYSVKVLGPAEVAAVMPRLRQISDLWLTQKRAHEKGFSLGYFDEAYVARTRIAVATSSEGPSWRSPTCGRSTAGTKYRST
jgi:lysylphosphatidylglycerol synthetase-like protein (DUF2156 family)